MSSSLQLQVQNPHPCHRRPASLAQWHAALDEMRQQVMAPKRQEQVTVPAAVGRVLAEPLGPLPAGTLLEWTHLPLLGTTGRRTLAVHPRLRAGLVTLSDPAMGESTAVTLAAAFEQMGGQPFVASSQEPPHRLWLALEMFANRCELIFVIGDLCPQAWPALKARSSLGGLPCFTMGSTLVLMLPPSLPAALVAFVAFAVPLIRKLQGRGDALPLTRLIPLAPAAESREALAGMSLVSERFSDDRMSLMPCADAPGLAQADGIAWRPEELADAPAGTLSYLPFDAWLS